MGNHDAGRAMGRMAEQLVARRRPGESALDLLDVICAPYRGADAEFEAPGGSDYRAPHMALGSLIVEAFAPNGLADAGRYAADFDDNGDAWYDDLIEPFGSRYGFC